MSEQERVNFLKAAVSRAPGKRQIKPSAAIFEDGGLAMDDDESDEDFSADGLLVENSDEEEENATATEGESDTESSGAGDAEDSDVEILGADDLLERQPDKLHSAVPSTSAIPSKPNGPLICSICLNMKHSTKGAEVIQCDKCGLAVHESCYIVEEIGDDLSTSSSSSTEPWFCEPCVFGLGIVPHCELCPSRYGAFKKADVGGGWVHLLCALYVPGISFADVEHLSGVSWQELDYKAFGRKQCIACQDKLEARTGITVQCEAGLCKNFYHVTCAQRLGLLVDVDTDDSQWAHYSERNGVADCNFLLCKRHNHNDLLQPKKDAYIRFLRQENQRMISLKRPMLNSRQEFKRRNQLQRYIDRMKKIGSNSSVLPSMQNKKTKMLHTNAQFLNAFAEKAELLGMERKDFEEKFMTIATEQLPNLAPAFSSSFVRYFERREEVELPDAEIRLAKAQADKAKVLSEQQMLESNAKLMQNELIRLHERHTQADQLLNRLCNVLYSLTGSKKRIVITKPKVNTTPTYKISRKRSAPTSPTTTSRSKANTTATKDHQTATSSTTSSAAPPTKQSVRRPNILSRSSPAKPSISFQRTNNTPLAIKIPGPEKSHALSPKSPRALTSKRSSRASISSPSPGVSRKLSISSGRNESKRSNDKTEPSTPGAHQWLAPNIALKSASSSLLETMQMHKCHSCEKMTDQHLLIYCGTCQHYNHLGCLDPPLKRMPVQNRNCVFECSDCACPSTSEEEIESKKEDEGENDDLNMSVAARRKVRKRISVYKSPHMLDSSFSPRTKKRNIKPVVKSDKKRTNTKENTTPKIETLLNGEHSMHSPGRHEQKSKQPNHSEADAFDSPPPRKKTVLHNPCLRQNNLLHEDRSGISREAKREVLQ
ncbi:PHD-zinc-finger like domain-containing protein [Ditylenchus destructor]|uniref:PHD-zinc-finger like domain-containing protein n=1 Tax=Ditylenchus destructor TaxID=166010 RepID=A0AAD4R5B1_9BILA|nr:PHD-zinc-finger like domain-containing protein [Ditylenchus destructor]